MRFRRRPEQAADEVGDEGSEWAPPERDEPPDDVNPGSTTISEPLGAAPPLDLADAPELREARQVFGLPERLPEALDEPEVVDEPEVLSEPEVLDEPAVLTEPEVPEEPEVPDEPEILDEEPSDVPEAPPAKSRAPVARATPVARRDWPPETSVVTDANGTVRAAGGLIWSDWGHRGLHVVVVHRRKYDDWSLPKGKAEWGESDPACALREVREETGLVCALGKELEPSSYTDRKGRPKTVRYWVMQPIAGEFTPNEEVDEIRWVPAAEAVRLLTYPRDAAMVAEFAAREPEAGD